MNKSFLIGRISSDIDLRYTTSNKAVCEFNLAINRVGSEGTDFLTCVVWNNQAENLKKYQNKGSLIAVEGSNRVDKYQTDKGENRYKHYILVSTIEYLGTKREESPANSGPVAEKPQESSAKSGNDPFQDFGDSIKAEELDLPF